MGSLAFTSGAVFKSYTVCRTLQQKESIHKRLLKNITLFQIWKAWAIKYPNNP